MNTLLHICCAPCANQCIDVLRTDGCAVTGYWYNPNIHPFTEYRSRRNCLRDYAASIGLPLIERNDYGLRPFVRAVAEDIDGRCVKCYSMRLYAAAHEAKEGGFDSFTSSLFISPYQNHELLREVAERAAAEYGVTFPLPRFPPAVPRRAGACAGAWHVHSEILRLRLLRGGALSQGEENSGGKRLPWRQAFYASTNS